MQTKNSHLLRELKKSRLENSGRDRTDVPRGKNLNIALNTDIFISHLATPKPALGEL